MKAMDVLEAVETLQVVGEEDGEQGDEDDALRRTEVAAVDAGRVHRGEEHGTALVAVRGARAVRRSAIQLVSRGWMAIRSAGHEDEDRHDAVEGRLRQHQQQQASGQAAQAAGDQERDGPGALAGQLAPIPDHAADDARDEPERVRDVGDERRIAQQQEGREADEGARSRRSC